MSSLDLTKHKIFRTAEPNDLLSLTSAGWTLVGVLDETDVQFPNAYARAGLGDG